MKGHYVNLFPVLTNVKKVIDLYSEYTYKKYIHRMRLFLRWDNHDPTQSWTIPIPATVLQCKRYICDVLQKSGLPHPNYIKLVKTVAGRHAYILLYTHQNAEDHNNIASTFEEYFPLPEDGYRMWKWRTYWHAYSPWESDDSGGEMNENESDEGENSTSDMEIQFKEMSLHNTATDAVDIEKTEKEHAQTSAEVETIPVYDYIMEETALNKYHMTETYPLYSEDYPVLSQKPSVKNDYVVSLQELCRALSDIDIQKI